MKEDLELELEKLKKKKGKITKKLKAVKDEIEVVERKLQGLCEHDWEHRYSDDHDGYSRVTYTQTKTSSCKKCGKLEVTKRDYDY